LKENLKKGLVRRHQVLIPENFADLALNNNQAELLKGKSKL
jgi:hypothetical protein